MQLINEVYRTNFSTQRGRPYVLITGKQDIL